MVLVLQNKLLQIPYLPQTLKTTHHYLYTWSSHFTYTEDEYNCFHPKNLLQPKRARANIFRTELLLFQTHKNHCWQLVSTQFNQDKS